MIWDFISWSLLGALGGWIYYRTWQEKLAGKKVFCILTGVICGVISGFIIHTFTTNASPTKSIYLQSSLVLIFIIAIFLIIWLIRSRHHWSKIQAAFDELTRKWWFLLLVSLLFFLPSYSSGPFNPQEIPQLIFEVMSNALIYTYPILYPVFKIIPILVIVGVILFGDRITRLFDIYIAVILTLFAVLQNTAITDRYGFAAITGNVIVYLLVALFWWWESIVKVNDFSPQKRPFWKYWVVPVAFLAFWFPINTQTITPEFNPLNIILNEAGLTMCMMIPVTLAVLTLFSPQVNMATMRVTSFAGLITSFFNILQWFIFNPQAWWMGVLHLPLLSISAYALILSLRKVELKQEPAKPQAMTRVVENHAEENTQLPK
jgi:hypothetical protein